MRSQLHKTKIMNEDFVKELAYMGLATRLKRISEAMIHSGRQMYKQLDLDIEPNWYLIFELLEKYETLSVTEMADKLRFAHPSVITIVKKMKDNGYLTSFINPDDTRKQQFKLSEKALNTLPKLKELWEYGKKGLSNIFADNVLLKELEKLEDALQMKSFKDRTLENYLNPELIKVVPFADEYAVDFAGLNYEWLHQYFEVEEYDREILENPHEKILDIGGKILMALNPLGKAIGTVALLYKEKGIYELAKMAVTPKYKGYKIGHLLMKAALKLSKEIGAKKVYLETNKKLIPAINLYKKHGFIEVEPEVNSKYERSNYKMELVDG